MKTEICLNFKVVIFCFLKWIFLSDTNNRNNDNELVYFCSIGRVKVEIIVCVSYDLFENVRLSWDNLTFD